MKVNKTGVESLNASITSTVVAHPRDILLSLQANARKSFSQNFLTSPHWGDRLTQLLLDTKGVDEIWEIGPGLGALTGRLLSKTSLPVVAFEIDRKLSAYLREQHPKLTLIEGDFLEADLGKLLGEKKKVAVLSNLPYHLSSAILFKLLEHKERFPRLVLTFQKEFANRLNARPGDDAYAALSVLMQLHFEVSNVGTIPPGAFYPAPAVSSEALLFEPKIVEKNLAQRVSEVVKAAFRQRRKKVASNLKAAFPKAPVESLLASEQIGANARPEELTLQHYLRLAQKVFASLILVWAVFSNASQDRNFGLGGESTGRVNGVTAESENPFAALYNPSLLASQENVCLSFSTFSSGAHYRPLGVVLSDSAQYRTARGEENTQSITLENSSSMLWAAALVYPFKLPDLFSRQGGIGIVLSGPYEKIRTFRAGSPYDFQSLRYGNSDQQFKGTFSAAVELWPETIYFGAGVSVYLTTAGSADAVMNGENPTGRLAFDVGLNTAAVTGLYARSGDTGFGLVYRQEINPSSQLTFDGKIQLGGQDVVQQPLLMKSSLYFEPSSLEVDLQHRFSFMKVSAGLAWQRWSHYQPAFLILTTQDSAGNSFTTQVPAIPVRDTLNPRASVSLPFLKEKLWISAGYQYRPTPLSDLSGPVNLLDSSTHVAGLSASYFFPASEGWLWPTYVSVYGQQHWMQYRRVDKQDPSFIGGPGYDISGTAYAAGITLRADL